jgi:hypothetical protein
MQTVRCANKNNVNGFSPSSSCFEANPIDLLNAKTYVRAHNLTYQMALA